MQKFADLCAQARSNSVFLFCFVFLPVYFIKCGIFSANHFICQEANLIHLQSPGHGSSFSHGLLSNVIQMLAEHNSRQSNGSLRGARRATRLKLIRWITRCRSSVVGSAHQQPWRRCTRLKLSTRSLEYRLGDALYLRFIPPTTTTIATTTPLLLSLRFCFSHLSGPALLHGSSKPHAFLLPSGEYQQVLTRPLTL